MLAVDCLVVIAGASGVGKTELLNRIRAGSLPSDVARYIPAAAPGWPAIRARKYPVWMPEMRELALTGQPMEGVILQVDTTGLHETPVEFAPAMQLAALAREVILTDVEAPPHRIVSQFLDREARWKVQTNPASLEAVKALCTKFWSASGRSAMDRLTIRSAALGTGMQERFSQRLANYRDYDWLKEIDASWQGVVRRHCAGREVLRLRVESTPGEPGGFSLIQAGPRAFAASAAQPGEAIASGQSAPT